MDVALKYFESGHSKRAAADSDPGVFKMIVFKIMYGKQTMAVARKDVKLAPIQATPGYNSHMSVIAPREKDDVEVQFDHSQVIFRVFGFAFRFIIFHLYRFSLVPLSNLM